MYCIEHCSKCIMLECDSKLCHISSCPNECGMFMHCCKLDEHVEHICKNTIVCCINKEFGCPFVMPRKINAFHLLSCPASVVSCNVPCSKVNSECSALNQTNSTNPDKLKTPISTDFKQPPFGPLTDQKLDNTTQLTNFHMNIAVKPFGNQIEQINEALDHLDLDKFNNQMITFVDSPLLTHLPDFNEKKPNSGAQTTCGQIVQRAYFSPHYQIHSNIEAQIDGWIELRCPLAFLGCKFVTVCLRPNNEKSRLLYNPTLATFTTRFITDNESPVNSHMYENQNFDFNKLPTDVLLCLSLYLDDYTLLSLSQISKRLNRIYRNILHSRLVVTPKWEKIFYKSLNTFTWKVSQFVWNFPERTETIEGWIFVPGLSARAKIATHLVSCIYNMKTIHTDPFTLLDKPIK